ncbi:Sensor protein ZraS [Pirellulimonas nuda]|uniref:histidine kinase n=1 Tax=Pirellulimonas nuda TaxID=2528009 RepID=A0A518DF35_9BACT|nr:ATP-binding protein [Pirellulimonas nuda]QDU90087.1 Sensor protein ZraS [Pirellulimonas nuda]
MPSLFVIQGRDQGTRYEIDGDDLSIGRISENAIQLNDTEVSRQHAQVLHLGDRLVIRDLNSSNGTFVNGAAIRQHELKTGDQVQVGRTLLLFTGVLEEGVDVIDDVDIIAASQNIENSRIVRAMSQSAGSELLSLPADQTQSPWLARARSNLQLMYRTALAVSHTMDIEQLLDRIMDMILEWVDADRGCIMLRDEETGELAPKVRRHRRGVQNEDRIAISKTILDYVVEKGEGVLTSNAREDDRWDPAQSIVQLGVREAICVPMQGRYGVVGVIYIDTSISPKQVILQKSNNKFGEEHLKLMIAIGHQAALAVEDTSYYKATVQAERLAAVGQTIATLSHHIKNILQGVRGGSYLIELGMKDHQQALDGEENDGLADPEAMGRAVETMRKGWGIVEKNQERISALVLDMLTFSKEREPDPQPSDLNEITADAIELMETRAGEAEVELAFDPAAEMPSILLDPEALHRAILNVVSNAIDACETATPEGGRRVRVATSIDLVKNVAGVTVSDNGVGIEKGDIDRIFTVFVSKKGGRGTGLGLPVTRKILEEHGGKVRVESKQGEGSTFTLELPIKRDRPARKSAERAASETLDDSPSNTLVAPK